MIDISHRAALTPTVNLRPSSSRCHFCCLLSSPFQRPHMGLPITAGVQRESRHRDRRCRRDLEDTVGSLSQLGDRKLITWRWQCNEVVLSGTATQEALCSWTHDFPYLPPLPSRALFEALVFLLTCTCGPSSKDMSTVRLGWLLQEGLSVWSPTPSLLS